MRLTTDFWVSALTRTVFKDGGFAAVMKRGAAEAGAVFVLLRDRLGRVALYGPAAQASYDSARPDERLFTLLMEEADGEAVDRRIAREARFDSDIWVIELETRGQALGDLIPLAKP